MNAVLRWWLFVCLSLAGCAVAYALGFMQFLIEVDKSYLSFVVMATYTGCTLWIGLMTYHARDGDQLFARHLHTCRFFSEALMGLGMVGTLIGYLFMVKAMMTGAVSVSDPAQATATVVKLAHGLGTSSIVTLLGLLGAIGLKAQITNLEYMLEDNNA